MMQLKNVESSLYRKLHRNTFINTLNIKKNIENLYKTKYVYCSKNNLELTDKNVNLSANLFFSTEKIIRYKRNLFNKRRFSRKKKLNKFKNKNKLKKKFKKKFKKVKKIKRIKKAKTKKNSKVNFKKLFPKKNIILKARILNKLVNKKYSIFLYNNLRSFNYSLFTKRYTLFFDLIKITSLTSFHKDNIDIFTKILGIIFKYLHKKKHFLFIAFLKQLLNLIVIKNNKSLNGMMIILNGKIQGKQRAKSLKIRTGPVSITSLNENIVSSKIHIYTLFGAYGLQIVANYKK